MYPDTVISTNIQLLRSSVASKRPAPASLLDGQAAVNLNDFEPGMYFKLTNGQLAKVGPVAVSGSGNPPNSSPTGSSGNSVGEMWFDGRAAFQNSVLKVFDGTAFMPSSGFTVNDATGDYSLAKTLTVSTMIANGVGADSFIQVPAGPTSDQGLISAAKGQLRFDTSTNGFKGYNGEQWIELDSTGGSGTFENLTVTGDTTLGNSCTFDTLNINARTAINCDLAVGNSGAQTMTVNSLIDAKAGVDLTSQTPARFHEGTISSNFIGFKAPANIPYDFTWTLPASDGSSNQVLSTNGAGDLQFITITGSGFIFNESLVPTADDAYDIGSPNYRVRNLYTGDLHLKNDRGDWTMIEEENYLSLRNNKLGKTFKIVMEEVK